jgi:hypothetical protein
MAPKKAKNQITKKIVKINQFGIPDTEPVYISQSIDEQVEWVSTSGAEWEIKFVQGPRPGKKSPFYKDKYKVKTKESSGGQDNTTQGEEYKYNILGMVDPAKTKPGKKRRRMTVTVDPTVIIDR